MILLRLAMVENMQGIRKMSTSGHDDCNSSSKGRLPRIVILASTLLHLGFPATPHGNGAANALARAEDVIDSARIELSANGTFGTCRERPCSIRRRLRSSQNVLQRSVELAGVTRKTFAQIEFFRF